MIGLDLCALLLLVVPIHPAAIKGLASTPTITLLGDQSKEIERVDHNTYHYSDDGALCHDDSDGDIDTSVVVHGDEVHVRAVS
jgi:hypothetical protein